MRDADKSGADQAKRVRTVVRRAPGSIEALSLKIAAETWGFVGYARCMPSLLRAALPLSLVLMAACSAERATPAAPTTSAPAPEEPAPGAPGPAPAPPSAPDAGQAKTKTLFVREMRAECEGVGPRTCLQVRESPSEDWTLFYAPIEGFTYEEGTRYELRVAVETVKNPAADSSSRRYVLVEIVSQERVPREK